MARKSNAADAAEPPSPEGGWSSSLSIVDKALLVPPEKSDFVQRCGVLDGNGDFVGASATWRGRRQMIVAPDKPQAELESLTGRHLFGGQFWAHFGHFMAESLSRLWALSALKEAPESIVFMPKRPGKGTRLLGYQQEFFDLLGIDIPIRIIDRPTRIDELIVPGQGFGLGDIAAGTDEFRGYFAERFATGVAAEGPEGLYLSRSALGGLEGGALAEEALEANLAKGGLEILHPQQLSITEQVARYRAARRVLGLDGSAFHLFGFVGRPQQTAGMILRRTSNVYGSIRSQLRSFCGIDPVVIDAVAADWIPEHKKRPGRYSFGELDFKALAQMLHQTGFGPPPEAWELPRFRQMKQAMKAHSRTKGIAFQRVKKPGRRFVSGAPT